MGWEDTLKGWANDASDFVEDTIDDAGDWIQDTVDDIAGENSWASKLVEKAGDFVDGEEGLAARAWDALDDYTGGTWAETAFDAVDGFADNGVAGAAGAATNLIGDAVKDTWVEDVYETAQGVVAGGADGAVAAATNLIGDAVKDTSIEDAGETTQAVVAGGADGTIAAAQDLPADAVDFAAVDSAWQGAADRGFGAGVNIDTGSEVGEDMVLRAAVEPDLGEAFRYDDVQVMTAAGPTVEQGPVDSGAGESEPVAEIPEATSVFEAPVSEVAAVAIETLPFEEPVIDIEPAVDATDFEMSLAAADQVQDSVDDMFADLG